MAVFDYELPEEAKKHWTHAFGHGGMELRFPLMCDGFACSAMVDLRVYGETPHEDEYEERGEDGGYEGYENEGDQYSSGPALDIYMLAMVEIFLVEAGESSRVAVKLDDERRTHFSPSSCASLMLARAVKEAVAALVQSSAYLALSEAKALGEDVAAAPARASSCSL